ncbi:Kinesin protein KIF6 [Phytophthora cinnamomi]|uniref:Kinesin protein KIF6 n=1 Tax=Phytophthora cinnamomi TaxID=4785 RepID=UPI00355AA09B|nr:Kinesin protein KIF6 [Phytophthora cinnamomi]
MESKPVLLFQMTVSKKHPVRASGIIYVLRKLGLLETVEENPNRAAIIFLLPAVDAKDFKRQNIISSGGSPQSIQELNGIGPLTMKTLAKYGVETVEQLKEGIRLFKQGNLTMKDSQLEEQGKSKSKSKSKSERSKHRTAWARAVKSWETQVESLSEPKYITMVENIPQYVSDATDTDKKRKRKNSKKSEESDDSEESDNSEESEHKESKSGTVGKKTKEGKMGKKRKKRRDDD